MVIWFLSHDLSPKIALIGLKDTDAAYGKPIVYYQGQQLCEQWEAPETMFYIEDETNVITDFPFHKHGILCCETKILQEIQPILGHEIEVLPIHVEGYEYSLLNVVNVLDALDKPKCGFEHFRSGDVKKIFRYAFKEEVLKGTYIFKTPELTVTDIYCTDAFRDLVLSRGWTGLKFTQVYPVDERPEHDRTV